MITREKGKQVDKQPDRQPAGQLSGEPVDFEEIEISTHGMEIQENVYHISKTEQAFPAGCVWQTEEPSLQAVATVSRSIFMSFITRWGNCCNMRWLKTRSFRGRALR